MTRALAPSDLVALPRGLDSESLHTLAQALIVPAKKAKLGKPLETALAALEEADKALSAATNAQLALPQGLDVRAADHAEDRVWSALFDVLTGWSKLPDEQAEGKVAAKLLAELFPDRLTFTQLPFKTEWSEVDKRITRIKKGGLGKSLASLGLQPFLDAIDDAHATYSAALGITTTPARTITSRASASRFTTPRRRSRATSSSSWPSSPSRRARARRSSKTCSRPSRTGRARRRARARRARSPPRRRRPSPRLSSSRSGPRLGRSRPRSSRSRPPVGRIATAELEVETSGWSIATERLEVETSTGSVVSSGLEVRTSTGSVVSSGLEVETSTGSVVSSGLEVGTSTGSVVSGGLEVGTSNESGRSRVLGSESAD